MVPSSIVNILIHVVAFLSYNLNIAIPAMAIEKHQFGSMLLTNVSGFGIKEVYGPLSNFTRNIATVVLCAPELRPTVIEGKIEVRKKLNLMITFDHRYQDGSGVPAMLGAMRDVWMNPQKYV
jgi:pyruvate/2-oxoglutarate dehydrogenase complex dihydrolipoamide acyltransferase (E2) component